MASRTLVCVLESANAAAAIDCGSSDSATTPHSHERTSSAASPPTAIRIGLPTAMYACVFEGIVISNSRILPEMNEEGVRRRQDCTHLLHRHLLQEDDVLEFLFSREGLQFFSFQNRRQGKRSRSPVLRRAREQPQQALHREPAPFPYCPRTRSETCQRRKLRWYRPARRREGSFATPVVNHLDSSLTHTARNQNRLNPGDRTTS